MSDNQKSNIVIVCPASFRILAAARPAIPLPIIAIFKMMSPLRVMNPHLWKNTLSLAAHLGIKTFPVRTYMSCSSIPRPGSASNIVIVCPASFRILAAARPAIPLPII
jgi:hypothetical protein